MEVSGKCAEAQLVGLAEVPCAEEQHAILEAVLAESASEAVFDRMLGIMAREGILIVPFVVELHTHHEARTSYVSDLGTPLL